MSAKYILISTYPLKNGVDFNDIKSIPRIQGSKQFYLSEELDTEEIVELRAYNDLYEICKDEELLESDFKSFSP